MRGALRRLAAPLAAVVVLSLAAGVRPASADASPSPCPSVDPNALNPGVPQTCIDQAKARQQALKDIQDTLGSTLAQGIAAQQQLSASILLNLKQQDALRTKIAANEVRQRQLSDQIAELDQEIADTQRKVVVEKARIRELARVVFTQPSSVLVMLAQARSLGDLITEVSDLMAAGSRADEMKRQLDSDVKRVSADRARVNSDRDQAALAHRQMTDGLAELQKLHDQEVASSEELQAKLDDTRSELQQAAKQSTAIAQQITQMLQEQQEAIIAAAMQQVWDQYEAWAKANPAPITGAPSQGHSDRKSTRLNSSHYSRSRMPSSA